MTVSLKIATVERNPYVVFVRDANGTTIAYRGYVFDIIDLFAEHYNLSYEVVVPADNEFGTDLGNGTWSGLVGLLLRKEVDMAAGFITITQERTDVIDFSVTLNYEGIDVLQRYPTKEPNAAALISPFAFETWAFIFVALALSGIALQITQYFGTRFIDGGCEQPSFLNGLGRCYFYVFRTSVSQYTDSPFSTSLHSLRFFCLTYVVFAFIVTSMYTASMTALMTIPIYNLKVKQIEDVTKYTDVRWLVRKGSSLNAEIATYKDQDVSVMVGLRNDFKKRKGILVNGDAEAQEMILRKGFVYLRENTILQALVKADFNDNKRCRFMLGQGLSLLSNEAFGFQKGSSFKLLFDSVATRLDIHGILIGAKRLYLPKKPLCPFNTHGSSVARSLGVLDFMATYVSLGVGLAASVVLFAVENMNCGRQFLVRCCLSRRSNRE